MQSPMYLSIIPQLLTIIFDVPSNASDTNITRSSGDKISPNVVYINR
jgi:hypothetical protein